MMAGRGMLTLATAAVLASLVSAGPWMQEFEAGFTPGFAAQHVTQRLDHFDATNRATFTQRYYVNDEHWSKPNGPVLLYIGGEGELRGPPGGYVPQLAQENGAMIVALEHRYYGASVPDFADGLTTSNLRFLSSEQAQRDLAEFRVWFQDEHLPGNDNAWLIIGGSYPGAMSAWFRSKFPHLVKGAIASSGVIDAVLDFTAFDEQISKTAGPKCYQGLKAANDAIDAKLAAGGDEKAAVKAMFQASDFTQDDGDFLYLIADSQVLPIQYSMRSQLCPVIEKGVDEGEDPLKVFAAWFNDWYVKKMGGVEGYSSASQMKTTVTPSMNFRQWWWQKCSEVAYFQNAPAEHSLRSPNLNMDYHRRHCAMIFQDSQMFPDTVATNINYGSLGIRGTNIIFTNGSEDPWQQAAYRPPALHDGQYPIYIECDTCGHCCDLRIMDDDPALKDARVRISALVKQFLASSD